MTASDKFTKWVKEKLKANGLGQKCLEQPLGISQTAVNKLLSGANNININQASIICHELGYELMIRKKVKK